MLGKAPGWLWEIYFVLIDRSMAGALPGAAEPDKQLPRFLALHDHAGPDGPRDSPEFRATILTPRRAKAHAYEIGDERQYTMRLQIALLTHIFI